MPFAGRPSDCAYYSERPESPISDRILFPQTRPDWQCVPRVSTTVPFSSLCLCAISHTPYRTRQDVVLPLSKPIRGLDGSTIHQILIPKDTVVIAGLLSSNRNKAIWGEDAMDWKPERWLSPLPEPVTDAKIPGIYSNLCVFPTETGCSIHLHLTSFLPLNRMTFLGGGRACMYVLLSSLLSRPDRPG